MSSNFAVGQKLYARWHGQDTVQILERAAIKSPFPHYICRVICEDLVDDEYWIIPGIQLSTSKISSETGDGNRKQLKFA